MHSVALIEEGFDVAGEPGPGLFFMVIPMRWIQEECVMNRGEISLSIAAPRRHLKTIQSIASEVEMRQKNIFPQLFEHLPVYLQLMAVDLSRHLMFVRWLNNIGMQPLICVTHNARANFMS